MIKVLHIILDLDTDGAQMALFKLVSNMDQNLFENSVVVLLGEGSMAGMIRFAGVEVKCLGYRQGILNPLMLVDVVKAIRAIQPDVIQTWMYHADLVGGLASLFVKRRPIIWGIRHSELNAESSKRLTRLVASLCAWASRAVPYRIILNSYRAKDYHVGIGYDSTKMVVIPNGFDLDLFRPNPEWRKAVRESWGVCDDALIVGIVSRFHADKDIRTFLEAASIVSSEKTNLCFALCGRGLTQDNAILMQWINGLSLKPYVRLLGERKDVPIVMNGFDIFALSSVTESFPNVIGEAMACGLICVATDVGDAKLIIGGTGFVVPPKNPAALAREWLRIVYMEDSERTTLGADARRRVTEMYDLKNVVTRYEALYEAIDYL
jgi:glycosyltransferase involved in cell wall biosynthesis